MYVLLRMFLFQQQMSYFSTWNTYWIENVLTENPYFLQINKKWLKVRVNVDRDCSKEDEDIESTTFGLPKAWYFLCGFTASYLKKVLLKKCFCKIHFLRKLFNQTPTLSFRTCLQLNLWYSVHQNIPSTTGENIP